MNKITIPKYLKWTSTFLTLFGILAFELSFRLLSLQHDTSRNFYYWMDSCSYTVTKDKPLLTNFALQIPIMFTGINYLNNRFL